MGCHMPSMDDSSPFHGVDSSDLHAEAARQTMGWRFASLEDRDAIIWMITDQAEASSLRLTPPELASSPDPFRREDGSSVFRPKASTV